MHVRVDWGLAALYKGRDLSPNEVLPLLQCSTTCGAGIQTRPVVCVDTRGQEVDSVYCEDDETPPPPSTTQCTNSQACCSWATQDWGQVSPTHMHKANYVIGWLCFSVYRCVWTDVNVSFCAVPV